MSKKIESMSRTMKDSGIPWIGEIPKGWKTAYLKHFCKVNSGREIEMESEASDVDAVPVFGSGGVFKYTNKAQFAGEAVMFGRKGTLGKPIYVNERFWAVDTMYYLTFGNMLKAKYCYYQLSVFNWEPYITQTALPSIVATDIVNSYFAFPPLAEQHLIAAFLDKKCSEIDSLIDLQEQMIEELKAYKQSVITEAVTKGLNPNVPMKDSGIEWIGDVPEEWVVCRIKNHIALNPSISIVIHPDTVVSYMPMECLRNGVIQERRASYKDVASYTPFQDNDIVMAKVTPCFENGNIAVAKNLSSGYGLGTSEIFVIRCKETANNQFVFYYLQSAHIKNLGVSSMTGTGGLKRVNPTIFNDGVLLLPPLAEQQAIADYLDKKCGEIDELITIKQQKIESLKEYKKSVIYEYVTGKKEP